MNDILDFERNMRKIEDVLKSTENLPRKIGVDAVPGSSKMKVDSVREVESVEKPENIQKTKITHFFKRDDVSSTFYKSKSSMKTDEDRKENVCVDNKRKKSCDSGETEKKIKYENGQNVDDAKQLLSSENDENARVDNKRKKSYDSDETEKKIKCENDPEKTDDAEIVPITVNNNNNIKKVRNDERCFICKQNINGDTIKFYNGHPNGAVDEFITLTDPKLMLFTGDESDVNDQDARPQNKITYFSIYDKEGHLCPFDSGLIENNKLLYFSGYVKPVYEENADTEGGLPTKDMGPINEWWVSGFDGGEKALLGFSTAYGEYYLMEPSDEYEPFMRTVKEKVFMSKLVIEYLISENWQNPSYEDLLNHLGTIVPPEYIGTLTEESLLRHAQFICDQVTSFGSVDDEGDENMLITTPCMRSLVKLAGVTFGKRKTIRRTDRKDFKKKSSMKWSKATTTALVQEVFESFFPEQLDKTKDHTIRRKRCGVCEACQLPDCGNYNR